MKKNDTINIIIPALLFTLFAINTNAQSERKFVRSGNKLYNLALADTTQLDTVNFSNAEVEYRKALAERPEELKWNFNLGNSLYKQKNTNKAQEIFKNFAENSERKEDKALAYHNLGNCYAVNSKFDEAIDAYKSALRNNPGDLETKYNLLWAMEQKKKQDEQNKDKDRDKDNQDQNKDKDQDKDNQNQNKQQNQESGQQSQKISKDNAEQMLQALENDEKQTQEKVKKAQALQAKQRKTDKDW